MRKVILFFAFLFVYSSVSAQFGISYQLSTNDKIGISYDFNPKLWVKLGFYDGVFFENFTVDAAIMYNFVNKEKHNVYIGFGGIVNFMNGIIVPIGVEVKPIKDTPNFSFLFEALPTILFEDESFIFF